MSQRGEASSSSSRASSQDKALPQLPPTHSRKPNTIGSPFALRPLLENVPLSSDGEDAGIQINCVEFYDRNLYVGTSAAELLHFVQIPPDPADPTGQPLFILASRLSPTFSDTSTAFKSSRPGVQQILLLPKVGKACILCNWTATFYSLPELSPVFGTVQVKNCNWVGGLDLNEDSNQDDTGGPPGTKMLLSLNRRIQVALIGDGPRVLKNIDFSGSTVSLRRDSIACVADSHRYALLDTDRQLKIPLMPISSLDDSHLSGKLGQAQSISSTSDGGVMRSASSAQSRPRVSGSDPRGHSRSTSLGTLISGSTRRQDHHLDSDDRSFQTPSPPPPSSSPVPPREETAADTNSQHTPDPDASSSGPAPPPKPPPVYLKPHITSPTPDEFLLVTGTTPTDPGIGIFVNLDGDPTRPTLEFDHYPMNVIVDGGFEDMSSSRAALGGTNDGYVLASMAWDLADGKHFGLEIQRWDVLEQASEPEKFWLEPPPADGQTTLNTSIGIRSLLGSDDIFFQEIVDKLTQRRFLPFSTSGIDSSSFSIRSVDSRTALSLEHLSKERELFERDLDSQDDEPLPENWESKRVSEEEDFVFRLAKTSTRIAVWSDSRIWWAARTPLLVQLEVRLGAAAEKEPAPSNIDRHAILRLLRSLQKRDARTELEFMTFNYLRQRAGVLLLIHFLYPQGDAAFSDSETKAMEDALVDSNLDPRVVLALIPGLRTEIIESRTGTWIFGGVKNTVDAYLESENIDSSSPAVNSLGQQVLRFLRRFLSAWRRKKGFGSIPDENEVFRTVDASLLLILLELDQNSPKGLPKASGTVRSELYEVVDRGVECFDRAATLLESYHRLFVLSRLYQSRKMASEVLNTWRRIVEGEVDEGGEFRDGEQRVREYLTKISNQNLVLEYGIWLANRNPKLGSQVFAEDKGRAPPFEPVDAVAILREQAPGAVKYYLEHLVFGKGHTSYVSDLIAYYLDVVVSELQASQTSRDTILATYDSYRVLEAPKPTYRQFLAENLAEDNEVWQSRLRLLQLLGGAHEYDAAAIRTRISSLPGDLLVPEIIILAGREHQHEDALRLLVHKLGDYDTAVGYCLRGGSSIYMAPGGRRPSMPTREQQAKLFRALLDEFLRLENISDRVEQTSMLLERFGGWFDVLDVLEAIPDSWSVDVVGGFLKGALQRLVREKNEVMIARALSSAENLRVNYEVLTQLDETGPSIEAPT